MRYEPLPRVWLFTAEIRHLVWLRLAKIPRRVYNYPGFLERWGGHGRAGISQSSALGNIYRQVPYDRRGRRRRARM